jgi:hypothetical protein
VFLASSSKISLAVFDTSTTSPVASSILVPTIIFSSSSSSETISLSLISKYLAFNFFLIFLSASNN